jgi:hypothetical protein
VPVPGTVTSTAFILLNDGSTISFFTGAVAATAVPALLVATAPVPADAVAVSDLHPNAMSAIAALANKILTFDIKEPSPGKWNSAV